MSDISAISSKSLTSRKNGDGQKEGGFVVDLGLWIPTGMTLVWTPNPGYSGTHGELPFSDPWQKVLAIVVAVIAGLVAIIAAALGAGTASAGFKASFVETAPSIKCCEPDLDPVIKEFSVASVASMIAIEAAKVALSDSADPFWRGQDATKPTADEITTSEKVVAKWSLSEPPNAGKAYSADVEWDYTRFTSGKTYTYHVQEKQTNIHVSKDVVVERRKQAICQRHFGLRHNFARLKQICLRAMNFTCSLCYVHRAERHLSSFRLPTMV